MKIGITYDLRLDYLARGYTEDDVAEFDGPETILAIESALAALGHCPEKIGNIQNLVKCLANGERWDMVFNIAEGLHGFGREAQVPAILDAYEIPYTFSDPLVQSIGLHKGIAKRIIQSLGIPTPEFFVVEREKDLEKINLDFPLFAKPVAEGTGKGVSASSMIENREELKTICMSLCAQFRQPVLVEKFLPGREFTVGILGTGDEARAIGVMEVVLKRGAEKNAYSYHNKENCEEIVEYRLAEDDEAMLASDTALDAWRGLGCRDGGRVDLRSDPDGIPNFMEVNTLPGLNPGHSDLPILADKVGISYTRLIGEIKESASKRVVALDSITRLATAAEEIT